MGGFRGYIGIGNLFYWGSMGVMEKKISTTILGYDWGLGLSVPAIWQLDSSDFGYALVSGCTSAAIAWRTGCRKFNEFSSRGVAPGTAITKTSSTVWTR